MRNETVTWSRVPEFNNPHVRRNVAVFVIKL